MKLATIRLAGGGTAAVRIDEGRAVELRDTASVSALLQLPDWRLRAAAADGPSHALETIDYAPVVLNPPKVICVGLNYRSHAAEVGAAVPTHPTLFTKFVDTLTGPNDPIELPAVSAQVDWEVELGVVVGAAARRVSATEATAAIAGYVIANDISMRDWQLRTSEWTQGKVFEASTPVGPWLVTPDEVGDAADLAIWCEVDGATVQRSLTSDLIFTPADVIAYVSEITTLRPGDLILTGTPAGVGVARDPQVFLGRGQTLVSGIEGLGVQTNAVVAQEPARAAV